MPEEILFTKMHGIGNDYIYINCLESTPGNIEQLAVEMSAPHTAVGSDGIILICRSQVADFKMRIFNADGSEAKMCGNGSRCVAKYVYDYGLTDSTVITLETLGGIKTIHLHPGEETTADVDMGIPQFDVEHIPAIAPSAQFINQPVATSLGEVRLTAVSMGNPHGVVIVDDPMTVPLDKIGPELEHHPMWPERANIELIAINSRSEITMRVWERGSGETMACGTGACASAAAAMRLGLVDSTVTVHLLGGDLKITATAEGNIIMSGSATTAYEGRYFRKSKTI